MRWIIRLWQQECKNIGHYPRELQCFPVGYFVHIEEFLNQSIINKVWVISDDEYTH